MKKEKRSSRLSLKQNYFFYLMILPTLLYLLIFQIYPIIETVRISFTNWLLTDQSSGGYVGFANYTRLFTQDSNFWTLFRLSLIHISLSGCGSMLRLATRKRFLKFKLISPGFRTASRNV